MPDIVVRIGSDAKGFGVGVKDADQAMDGLGRAAADLGRSLSRAVTGPLDGFSSALSRIGAVAASPVHAVGGLTSALGALGLAGLGLKTLAQGVAGVATGMVSGNAEMETYETQLGTLLGSADKAKERLAELAKFGAETPFELPEVVRAEKVLLGFGLTGQKVVDLTGKSASEFRTLTGDIAAGTGAAFEEIALNMGKFASGATGEAISRFQEMGIATREQMTALGVQFSKSGELLSPLPIAMQAIVKISQEKFGGGMDKLSKTFGGQMSTLADNFNQAKNVVMAPIFDVLKDSVGTLNTALSGEGFQRTLRSVAELLAGAVKRGVDAATVAFGLLMDVFNEGGDLGVFADDLRELFGIDISPLVAWQRWLGDVLPAAIETLRTALVQVYERATTFFGSLVGGETLATAVNKAFGDLIPPELNPILDATDRAFAALKTTVQDFASALRTGGITGVLDEIGAKLRSAGAPETAGAFQSGLADVQTAMRDVIEIGTGLVDGLGQVAQALGMGSDSTTDWGRVVDQVIAGVIRSTLLPITAFNTLVTGARTTQAAITAAWASVRQATADAMFLVSNTITTTWAAISSTVNDTTNAVITKVGDSWESIRSTTNSLWTQTKGHVKDAFDGILNIQDSEGTTLREAIATNWSTISTGTDNAWKGIKGYVESWSVSARDAAKTAADAISTHLGGPGSGVWSTVRGNTDSAWSSVKTNIVTAIESARDSAKNAADAIKDYLGSAGAGVWGTITSNTASAWSAAGGIAGLVSSAISEVASSLSGSGIGTAAGNFGRQMVTGIADGLSGLGSSLSQKLTAAINSIYLDIGIFHFRGGTFTWTFPTITAPTISLPGTNHDRLGADLSGVNGGMVGGGINYSRLAAEIAKASGPSYSLQVTGGGGISNAEEIPRLFQRMQLLAAR